MGLKLNIFNVDENYTVDELKDIILNKMILNKIKTKEYKKLSRKFGKDDADFYMFFGKKQNKNKNIYWYENMKSIFDDLDNENKTTTSIYGIVLVDLKIREIDNDTKRLVVKDRVKCILTFSNGFHVIGDGSDMNYGLEMASKMAREDSINTQSSKFFSLNKSKSLVIYNSANFNTQIGEAVDYMSAKIEEQSGRTAIKQLLELIDENVTFSTCIKTIAKKDLNEENLYKILKNLYIINKEYKTRFQIPKLKILGAKYEKLKKELNENLKSEIMKRENSSISIGTYMLHQGQIEIMENYDEYELSINRNRKTYNSLTIKEIKDFMKEFEVDDITKIKLRIGGLDTKDLYKFIDFTTTLKKDDNYYCLSNGRWTRFNKEYVKRVDEEIHNKIQRIVDFNEELNLKKLYDLRVKYSKKITGEEYDSSKDRKLYAERVYNCWLSDYINGKLLDRSLSDTLEIADVLDINNKALIHTKIGDTGNFIECISQSTNGARLYLNNTSKVIKDLGKELEGIKGIELLLIINNNDVWKNQDIGKFKSLRFKLELLEWYNNVLEMNYTPKIVIAKNENKNWNQMY